VERPRRGDMGAGRELPAPFVQVDLLVAELESQPLCAGRPELLDLHSEDFSIEMQAGFQVPRRQDDMIDMVDQGFLFSIRSGLYSSTVSPRWLITLLAKRTRPRSPLEVRRASVTSDSTWMVSPTAVGALMSTVAFRKASPVSCMVGSSKPSAKE